MEITRHRKIINVTLDPKTIKILRQIKTDEGIPFSRQIDKAIQKKKTKEESL